MAIIETTSSEVKKMMDIYDREKVKYQKDFEVAKDERIKGFSQNRKFSKELFNFSPFILMSAMIVFLSVAGDSGWIDKSISVNSVFVLFGIMFFSIIGLIIHADNSYKGFESTHYSDYNTKVSKEDASMLTSLYNKFTMSSKGIHHQDLGNGEYSMRFSDIQSLKNQVVRTAFVTDN